MDRSTDRDVDALFPPQARKLARGYWTPVAVARAAAAFLAPTPAARVLDVGSGAGKFCLVGAVETGAHFTGIEQEKALVAIARDVCKAAGVARVRFQAGDAFATDWTPFDGIYLFNPFTGGDEAAFVKGVAQARTALETLRSGTRVALYRGYGGERPDSFALDWAEEIAGGTLELWLKR